MKCLVVAPARLASTRLPRKSLLNQTGKTLIQHVWEGASKSKLASEVVIATDSDEILRAVVEFGGRAIMTSPLCSCGTERVAEAAKSFPDAEIVVNVQGDEPEISGECVDEAARLLLLDSGRMMATLATPILERERLEDPACVKVVFDPTTQRALYFTRSVVPYPREGVRDEFFDPKTPLFYQHLGIYAYRRDFLLRFCDMPRSRLEKVESLEQLRVLENGHDIFVGVVSYEGNGIDTPEDYARFVQRCREAS
ncbi:MAG: 3-deoxy-manno-octulosonate cytidylyltransferase [Planctomycetia bacterium]|nr:3-deoxy-manno-octulosonate cytidylyltransferase [Planctomycetia bacterium]